MSVKLPHALLVADHLKVHIYNEVFNVVILIRAFKNHADVVDRAEVAFAYVDYNTRVLSL